MEKLKGIVEEIKESKITLGKGTENERQGDKFTLKFKGDERTFSGWGTCPYKKDEEIEIEYEMKTSSQGATYFNIRGKEGKRGGFADVIKALTMPKVTVGYERTRQVNQFEPVKVSVYVSMNSETIDPKIIDDLIYIAKTQVEAELDLKENPAKAEKKYKKDKFDPDKEE